MGEDVEEVVVEDLEGEFDEVEEDDSEQPNANGTTEPIAPNVQPKAGDEGTSSAQTGQAAPMGPNGAMPQAVLSKVQDEGLKNLMISWYYAGYYTGLYEGQQKAYAEMGRG